MKSFHVALIMLELTIERNVYYSQQRKESPFDIALCFCAATKEYVFVFSSACHRNPFLNALKM